mmetsp:Transcript_17281/g.33690  ORF Transcript_17281/g.33690 Transcript_17281/m.33690 type:complete len:211 (-) Transcript_17281:900-1532(-)
MLSALKLVSPPIKNCFSSQGSSQLWATAPLGSNNPNLNLPEGIVGVFFSDYFLTAFGGTLWRALVQLFFSVRVAVAVFAAHTVPTELSHATTTRAGVLLLLRLKSGKDALLTVAAAHIQVRVACALLLLALPEIQLRRLEGGGGGGGRGLEEVGAVRTAAHCCKTLEFAVVLVLRGELVRRFARRHHQTPPLPRHGSFPQPALAVVSSRS